MEVLERSLQGGFGFLRQQQRLLEGLARQGRSLGRVDIDQQRPLVSCRFFPGRLLHLA